MLLHLETVVEVVENFLHFEGLWYLVTLQWNWSIVFIARVELGKAVGQGDEMAANIFTIVGYVWSLDEGICVDRRKMVSKSLILTIIFLTVTLPVWFRICRLADSKESLDWLDRVEVFLLLSLAIEQDLVVLVVLFEVNVILVVIEKFTLNILICIFLHLAPLRSHNLEESSFSKINWHNCLA